MYQCVTGCEKFADEKSLVKMLRKLLASELNEKDLPIKAIAKKRGQSHFFVQFTDADQKKAFTEMFVSIVTP